MANSANANGIAFPQTTSHIRTRVHAQPATPATHFSNIGNHTIEFKHPGYTKHNIFLILRASDLEGQGGLHYGTAHVACAIVAANSWNGYFTRDREGRDRVFLANDELLLEKDYYFHVPGPLSSSQHPYVYPLCSSFEHWSFPHGNLPPAWENMLLTYNSTTECGSEKKSYPPPVASGLTNAVVNRDEGCLVTGFQDCVEAGHLCPRSQVEWFLNNDMDKYSLNDQLSGPSAVDDVSNAVSLRSDLHTEMDRGTFVIVPKGSQWVVHFLGLTHTLGSLYHNVTVELKERASIRLLLVRFAHTIFPRIQKFFERGVDRPTQLRVKDNEGMTEITRMMSMKEHREQQGSRSPKKRKAAEAAEATPDRMYGQDGNMCSRGGGTNNEEESMYDLTPQKTSRRRHSRFGESFQTLSVTETAERGRSRRPQAYKEFEVAHSQDKAQCGQEIKGKKRRRDSSLEISPPSESGKEAKTKRQRRFSNIAISYSLLNYTPPCSNPSNALASPNRCPLLAPIHPKSPPSPTSLFDLEWRHILDTSLEHRKRNPELPLRSDDSVVPPTLVPPSKVPPFIPFSKRIYRTPKYLQEMKQEWLHRGRPTDPNLYCCDLSAAEKAMAAGIDGPKKFGGRHLCWECMGVEYFDTGEDWDNDIGDPVDTDEGRGTDEGSGGDKGIGGDQDEVFGDSLHMVEGIPG